MDNSKSIYKLVKADVNIHPSQKEAIQKAQTETKLSYSETFRMILTLGINEWGKISSFNKQGSVSDITQPTKL